MKTQIIQLDTHDDYISARDKMGWSQANRILLVWPSEEPVLRRRIDLVLLQRHSKVIGAQLAVVCRDPLVRDNANQVGVPVFKSTRQAQSHPWRLPRRQRGRARRQLVDPEHTRPDLEALRQDARPESPEWLSRPFTRLALFTIGVLALLSIAAVLVPSARVSLTPLTRTQEITLVVHADPEAEAINLSAVVPAREVVVEVQGRSSTPTSGDVLLPDRYATGRLTFTNLSEDVVQVPAGTIVRNGDGETIRFRTTEDGDVPAGVGQSATIPAQASSPGSVSNLPAASLVVIEGPLGLTLTVSNPLATRGGSSQRISAPSEADREQLFDTLEETLHQTALEDAQSGLDAGDWLYAPSLTLEQVVEQVYDPADDQPADQLSLDLRLEYQGLSVSGEDVTQLARDVLNANLPDGYAPSDDKVEVVYLSSPAAAGGDRFSRQVRFSRTIQAQLPTEEVINLTLGLSPAAAANRLAKTLPLEGRPQLTLSPSWWPRMPYLPFRVTVEGR